MDDGRFHREALKLLFEKRMAGQLHRKGSVLMDVPKYRSFDELVEAADTGRECRDCEITSTCSQCVESKTINEYYRRERRCGKDAGKQRKSATSGSMAARRKIYQFAQLAHWLLARFGFREYPGRTSLGLSSRWGSRSGILSYREKGLGRGCTTVAHCVAAVSYSRCWP